MRLFISPPGGKRRRYEAVARSVSEGEDGSGPQNAQPGRLRARPRRSRPEHKRGRHADPSGHRHLARSHERRGGFRPWRRAPPIEKSAEIRGRSARAISIAGAGRSANVFAHRDPLPIRVPVDELGCAGNLMDEIVLEHECARSHPSRYAVRLEIAGERAQGVPIPRTNGGPAQREQERVRFGGRDRPGRGDERWARVVTGEGTRPSKLLRRAGEGTSPPRSCTAKYRPDLQGRARRRRRWISPTNGRNAGRSLGRPRANRTLVIRVISPAHMAVSTGAGAGWGNAGT